MQALVHQSGRILRKVKLTLSVNIVTLLLTSTEPSAHTWWGPTLSHLIIPILVAFVPSQPMKMLHWCNTHLLSIWRTLLVSLFTNSSHSTVTSVFLLRWKNQLWEIILKPNMNLQLNPFLSNASFAHILHHSKSIWRDTLLLPMLRSSVISATLLLLHSFI